MSQHAPPHAIPSFPDFTIESAPPAARRTMAATEQHLGYLPAGMARMAASPQLLDGFMKLNAIFESSTLSPLARETLIMTIATRNGCHVCIAMHTARLTALGADAGLIARLRKAGSRSGRPDSGRPDSGRPDSGRPGAEPLPDAGLEAIRVFTLQVLGTAGDVGGEALRAFLASGYTSQNALEVVLGVGTYTLSTFANRLTGAPVDDQLAAFA
jgi:AhpD family alkylhydroperoxidase